MRRTIAFGILVVVSASCDAGTGLAERAIGDGTITTVERTVGAYTEVVFASEGIVEIRQGGEESLEVIADQNLHEFIETDVDAGVLTISTEAGFDLDPSEPPVFLVGADDLARLSIVGAGSMVAERIDAVDLVIKIEGAGDVSIADIDVDVLDIRVPGAGDVTVAGTARRLLIAWSGAGSIDSTGVATTEVLMDITGVVDARIGASDVVRVSGSGAGAVTVAPGSQLIDQTGAAIIVSSR